MKKMTLWGVGPKIMFPGYSILVILSWIPIKISIIELINIHRLYIIAAGIILFTIGVILLAVGNSEIKKALETKQLVTSGVFSRIRNLMYAAHLFFIMPGVCLLTNNAITLLSIICTMTIFYFLISKEEKVLEDNFGLEYIKYKNNVGRLLPRF